MPPYVAVTLMSVQGTCQMLPYCSTKAWHVPTCPLLLEEDMNSKTQEEEQVWPPGAQCWYLLYMLHQPERMIAPDCHYKLTEVPPSKVETVPEH